GEVIDLMGVRIGVSICEDLWTDRDLLPRQLYHIEPIDRLAKAGAQVIINCSASPFVLRKQELRVQLLRNTARRHHLPVIYGNQVGGNDELVFDGNSCAVNAQGELIAHARAFEPDLLVFDLDHAEVELPRIARPEGEMESAYHALVLGLRDYMRKCGFKSAVLGLSGGIDSALTCALAVAAVGKENVRGVSMPSRFSSGHSRDDAADLAKRLGIAYHSVAIEDAHQSFEEMMQPHFKGLPLDATEENIQARIRGVILMAFSNKFGSILLTTGNKSELAVGYCTLYGDMAGGLAVLSDVPKTLVWKLSRWINESPHSPLRQQYGGPVIPDSSIAKVPSAELRPNQTDQDSLPPYDQLDNIIERYVEREHSARQIVEDTGYSPDLVLRVVQLIDRNEYKRKQAAPGLKITGRAFGFGRRVPIAQRYDSRRSIQHPDWPILPV
ncbi:MAG: NAD+ synthase, partial [Phycisphaeraceae bacterium]|nr:NAD+ synthase [Phycisphaeraceae bacterium]